jgi:hypothetical protein
MNIKKRFLLWLMQTKFYGWALIHVIPYIRFSMYYTSFKGWKFLVGYFRLKPGDIILTCDKKKLTSLLIPGPWSHGALCVNKCNGIDRYTCWEVSEMTHTNYTMSAFFDICKESDRVAILRCPDWDEDYIKQVIMMAASFVYALYDKSFDLGIKELYCFELIYQSDFERRLQVNLDDLAGLGRQYLSGTGIWNVYAKGRNLDLIWDSDDEIREVCVKTFLNYKECSA